MSDKLQLYLSLKHDLSSSNTASNNHDSDELSSNDRDDALRRRRLILFSSPSEVPFGAFALEYPTPVRLQDGRTFGSAQACIEALLLGSVLNNPLAPLDALWLALFAKFWNSSDLFDLLSATEGYRVAFVDSADAFLGCTYHATASPDMAALSNGFNLLGQLLEELRSCLTLLRLQARSRSTKISDTDAFDACTNHLRQILHAKFGQHFRDAAQAMPQSLTTPTGKSTSAASTSNLTPPSTPLSAASATSSSNNTPSQTPSKRSVASDLNQSMMPSVVVALIAGGIMFWLSRHR